MKNLLRKEMCIPGKFYIIEPGVTAECVKVTKKYVYFKGQQLYDEMFEESTNKNLKGLFPFAKEHKFLEA